MSGKSLVFDIATMLPDQLRQAAFRVTKLYSHHVALDDLTPARLNWDGLKEAIVARSGSELSVVKTESTTIVNHTASIDDMAGKISQSFYDMFSLQGTDDEYTRTAIHKAFQDVSSAASGNIITSSTHESRGKTWENHIVRMAPNPDDADSFYAVIASVGVSAYIYEYKGPLGIGNESRHDYSANIAGIMLLVKKTYRQD